MMAGVKLSSGPLGRARSFGAPRRNVRWLGLTACTAVLSSSPAKGEEAAAVASEEILITDDQAKKRASAPVATSTLDSEQLENSGIRDLRGVAGLAPSVQFQTPGGISDSSFRIRGIGTASTNPGLESAVAVVIDGVPRARSGVALSALGELERIEVLRGPQGTQFGRNAAAGLLNVVTKTPRFDVWSGHLQGTVGAFQDLRIAAALNAPLFDGLALRLEASAETRRGFFVDQNSREDLDDINRQFARAKLRWKVGPKLFLLVSADIGNRQESCCIAVLAKPGDSVDAVNRLAGIRGEHGYTSTDPFDRQAVKTRGRVNQEDVLDWGVSAQSDLLMEWGQLTSIYAYRSWGASRAQDFDHSGVDLGFFAPNGLHQRFDVFTQEQRLRGRTGELSWSIGAFFAFEQALYDSTYRMGADYPAFFGGAATFQPSTLVAFTPGDGARGVAEQKGTEISVFTHDTYRVTDELSVTGGLRATFNRKSLEYSGENFNPACESAVATSDMAGIARFCAPFWDTRFNPVGDTDSRVERALTGTVNVAYEFVPAVQAFVAFSRGYKAGGYQFDRGGFTTPATPNARDLSFPKETVDAYQTGVFSDPLAGALSANLTLFHQRIEGLQLIEYTGSYFVVRSLAESFSSGAELEVAWRPLAGLAVTSGLSYTDAFYSNDPGNLSYAGHEMEQAPDWVNVSSVTWEVSIGRGLKGLAYADNRFSSKFLTSGFDASREQAAFSVTNARLALRSDPHDWSVEVWARNLFDTNYYRRVFPSTFQSGSLSAFLGEPRTYGLTVRRNF
jgi:outer membrane receptor protein involved in Fe transport